MACSPRTSRVFYGMFLLVSYMLSLFFLIILISSVISKHLIMVCTCKLWYCVFFNPTCQRTIRFRGNIHPSHKDHVRISIPNIRINNEKRDPGCLVYIGDEILPSYVGINFTFRIPINQPSIVESRSFFFPRGSHGTLGRFGPFIFFLFINPGVTPLENIGKVP